MCAELCHMQCTARVPNYIIYCVLHVCRIVVYNMYCTCGELWYILCTARVPNCIIFRVLHVCRTVLYTVYCTCAESWYIICTAHVANCGIYCVLHVCRIVLYTMYCTRAELCYVLCTARVPHHILHLCLLNCLSESTFLCIAPKFPKECCFLEGSLASSICPSGKSNVYMQISVVR